MRLVSLTADAKALMEKDGETPLHDERVQPSILALHSLLPGEQQPGLLQSPTQEPLSHPEKGGGALNGVEADQTLTPEDQKGGAFLNPQGQGAEYGVGTLKPTFPRIRPASKGQR